MVEPEGLRKSAGAGREGILQRSVCEPLAPDSLSELNTSMLKSVKGSAKPGTHKSERMPQAHSSQPDLHNHTQTEPKIMQLSNSGTRSEISG